MSQKLRIGLFFGGRSTEHEVSVVSALQAYENIDQDKYEVVPIYVSKAGQFYSGPQFLDLENYQDLDQLLLSSAEVNFSRRDNQPGLETTNKLIRKFTPIDVALPVFHGSFGEDGAAQGLFEMYKIPYAGFNVVGSAVAMDKVIAKAVFQSLGIPIGKFVAFSRNEWLADPKICLLNVKKALKFPLFVKPADGGSTIGINRAEDEDQLTFNIEVAAIYSDKILIEEAFQNCIEVNCAALGYVEVISSVCEMPIRSGDALSFEDKYMRGGKGSKGASFLRPAGMASLSRQIPAPISGELAKQIQETTVKVFKHLEGCGVARIDYFVDPETGKFWINEINSPPGSLAYYLFEPIGIKYSELLDRLISDALKRFADQQKTQFTFDSGLLEQMAAKGVSGQKR